MKLLDSDYCEMVREMLATTDKGFSDWEIEFLDDMWKRTWYKTNQSNKIEEIYNAKM